jgi:hypothetical protein
METVTAPEDEIQANKEINNPASPDHKNLFFMSVVLF